MNANVGKSAVEQGQRSARALRADRLTFRRRKQSVEGE